MCMRRCWGLWHQGAQLQPAAVTTREEFGVSVDINSDMLICGADLAGYAPLFYRSGDNWGWQHAGGGDENGHRGL